MLLSLRIRNLAIIDELELEFPSGFIVLTGETGAGKSILIDALGLIIGARADAALVRSGCERAEAAAEFTLDAGSGASRWLREHELDDDGACLLRRVVQSDGRTRAFINGRPVSVTELRELGEHLVEIFGQGESQTLLQGDTQRQRLDDYARHPALLSSVSAAAARVRDCEAAIETLRSAQSRDPAELDYLRHQLADLTQDQLARLTPMVTLHERDGAEGAALIAAVTYFLVSARAANMPRRHLEVKLSVRRELHEPEGATGSTNLFQLRDHARQNRPIARTDECIDRRKLSR